LEIIVTEYLYLNYPDKPEGELTNWRASLVNSHMLAEVAKRIELEDHLYLSKGEAKDKNTKARQFILANAVEALIGAIYLDQGRKAAEKFVHELILSRLDYILEHKLYLDAKSKFQEKSQEEYGVTPHYKVLQEYGPDHNKEFEIGVYLGEELVAKAVGTSKQEAQTKAAQNAITRKGW